MDASKSKFYQYLLTLKRIEIDDVRVIFDCDVDTRLKKQEFALAVADYILNESEYWMRKLPTTEIQYIDQILQAGPYKKVNMGFLPYESILEEYRMVEAEYDEYDNCFYSVDESMYNAFKYGIDNAKAFLMAKDCIPYEAIVRGVLNLYGVIPCEKMWDLLRSAEPLISAQTGYYSPQPSWYIYISEALLLHNYVCSYNDTEYFFNPTIEDHDYFIREQLSRKNLEYKEFSIEQLQDAGGNPPFCMAGSDFPQSKAMMKEFRKHVDNFDEVVDYDNMYCLAQDGIKGIIDMVTEELEFPSLDAVNKFIGLVNDFSNHIPHWTLKGWSPNEVFQKFEKPSLNPLPKSTAGSPIDALFRFSENIKKVGRNDPCPCGSGKKYKECHGKYQS